MKRRQSRRKRRFNTHEQTVLAVMAMMVVKREHVGELPAGLKRTTNPKMAWPLSPQAREIAFCLQRPVQSWPKLKVSADAKDAAQQLLSAARRRFSRYQRP